MLNLIDMMSIYHRVPKFILLRLWNHARIRSWHQPVLSKEGKVSCWGKMDSLIVFELPRHDANTHFCGDQNAD